MATGGSSPSDEGGSRQSQSNKPAKPKEGDKPAKGDSSKGKEKKN